MNDPDDLVPYIKKILVRLAPRDELHRELREELKRVVMVLFEANVRTLPRLVQTITSEQESLALAAVELLSRINLDGEQEETAYRALFAVVADPNTPDAVRAAALSRLGYFSRRYGLYPLAKRLALSDPSKEVRLSAIYALGFILISDSVRILAGLVTDQSEDVDVRKAAMEAIAWTDSFGDMPERELAKTALRQVIDSMADGPDSPDGSDNAADFAPRAQEVLEMIEVSYRERYPGYRLPPKYHLVAVDSFEGEPY